MWDIGGDGFDSIDIENAGILEIANLSLDEPELEAILFDSEGNVIFSFSITYVCFLIFVRTMFV